jgi:hypothetical protein
VYQQGTGDVIRLIDGELAAFVDRILLPASDGRETILLLMSDHGLHMGIPYLLSQQVRLLPVSISNPLRLAFCAGKYGA